MDAARCPTDPLAPVRTEALPVPVVPGARYGKVSYPQSVALADHQIALTFDDGPDDKHTAQVLAILRRHCLHATFFLVGQEVEADPGTVRQIAAQGHTLGAHSQTHPDNLADLPLPRAQAEIDDSIAALTRALSTAPAADRARQTRFFRFPSVIDSPALLTHLKDIGQIAMSVDYGIDDWEDTPAEQILARAILRTEERGRGVMLLHDYNPEMIAILDRLIVALENRGYRFVQLVEQP